MIKKLLACFLISVYCALAFASTSSNPCSGEENLDCIGLSEEDCQGYEVIKHPVPSQTSSWIEKYQCSWNKKTNNCQTDSKKPCT